jgi:hypothetical protein
MGITFMGSWETLFYDRSYFSCMNMVCKMIIFLCITLLLAGCMESPIGEQEPIPLRREDAIPEDAVKVSPRTDAHPPILHSGEWEEPVPVEGPINTAGAEDSPFIHGDDFYFFFTPDPHIPVEQQLVDGVTGIYVSHMNGGKWSYPERVILEERGKCSLDGCTFVKGDTMWFCSAREGYTGVHWFTAEFHDGTWTGWKEVGFDPTYEVGELHITADGSALYFHSSRPGGKGGLDIWVCENRDGTWQEPTPVEVVNTGENEGWPFITAEGGELWFNRTYQGSPALFRSRKIQGEWQEPELIMSQFTGEPTLDGERNLYFVHHFYRDGIMIEADIYVAYHTSSEKSSLRPEIAILVMGLIFGMYIQGTGIPILLESRTHLAD